jgi:hypothetical protein
MLEANIGVRIGKDGSAEFLCPKCGDLAKEKPGDRERDVTACILICCKCGAVLGEWLTREERETALKNLAGQADVRISPPVKTAI